MHGHLNVKVTSVLGAPKYEATFHNNILAQIGLIL